MFLVYLIPIVALTAITWAAEEFNICGTGRDICDSKEEIRSYDGSCNNLKNPRWGTPNSTYFRLLPAVYGDGKHSYRKAKSGKALPNPRLISSTIYTQHEILDFKLTLNAMQIGQLFSHDLSQALEGQDDGCCSSFKYSKDMNQSECSAIPVPPDDPVYSKIGAECLSFIRTQTNVDSNCSLSNESTQQQNAVPSYIDLHLIYGPSEEENKKLRSFVNGQLKVVSKNGQDFPINSANPAHDCPSVPNAKRCFYGGDSRNSQNPQLAVLVTIILRQHNRIAQNLAKINPHWDDEKIFQTARMIMIGMFQHICVNEIFPLYAGSSLFEKIANFSFSSKKESEEYDPTVNPGALAEFSLAFRYAHTLVAGPLDLMNENRAIVKRIYLRDSYHNVSVVEEGSNCDNLLRGLLTEPAWFPDIWHEEDITQWLFFNHQNKLGQDLKALDIARSRDHGIASYNEYRVFCGKKRATYFFEFLDVMDFPSIRLLQTLYEHPDDVDFMVGGSLERLYPGSLAGPTFRCVWIKQFTNIIKSDRFFYNVKGGPFTPEQLEEIQKTTSAKWYCANSNITKIQKNSCRPPSLLNPLVSCDSLPEADLTKWKE